MNRHTNSEAQVSKSRRLKIIILIAAIIFSAILAYFTTVNRDKFLNSFESRNQEDLSYVDEKTGELTETFFENVSDLTVEDIKEASTSTGVNILESPSLSDKETSEKIFSELENTDPVNHELAYSEYGISMDVIEIRQGDMVTWMNTAPTPMSVVGDGWKSQIAREPGENFSYGFLFLGEYKYKINDLHEGLIIVTK